MDCWNKQQMVGTGWEFSCKLRNMLYSSHTERLSILQQAAWANQNLTNFTETLLERGFELQSMWTTLSAGENKSAWISTTEKLQSYKGWWAETIQLELLTHQLIQYVTCLDWNLSKLMAISHQKKNPSFAAICQKGIFLWSVWSSMSSRKRFLSNIQEEHCVFEWDACQKAEQIQDMYWQGWR